MSDQISKMSPGEYRLYTSFQNYNMKDTSARSLAKFTNCMDKSIKNAPVDKQWSEAEISSMLKDSLAERSLSVNKYRD